MVGAHDKQVYGLSRCDDTSLASQDQRDRVGPRPSSRARRIRRLLDKRLLLSRAATGRVVSKRTTSGTISGNAACSKTRWSSARRRPGAGVRSRERRPAVGAEGGIAVRGRSRGSGRSRPRRHRQWRPGRAARALDGGRAIMKPASDQVPPGTRQYNLSFTSYDGLLRWPIRRPAPSARGFKAQGQLYSRARPFSADHPSSVALPVPSMQQPGPRNQDRPWSDP